MGNREEQDYPSRRHNGRFPPSGDGNGPLAQFRFRRPQGGLYAAMGAFLGGILLSVSGFYVQAERTRAELEVLREETRLLRRQVSSLEGKLERLADHIGGGK